MTSWPTGAPRKYERGARLVGGRWYGTAIVMGKVGRSILIYHRRNMFKVSPEHLRHATLEERAVAQSDGREMLGIAQYVGEGGTLRGSHYVDLTNKRLQVGPESMETQERQADQAVQPAISAQPSGNVSAQPSSSVNTEEVVPHDVVDESPAESKPSQVDSLRSEPFPEDSI